MVDFVICFVRMGTTEKCHERSLRKSLVFVSWINYPHKCGLNEITGKRDQIYIDLLGEFSIFFLNKSMVHRIMVAFCIGEKLW